MTTHIIREARAADAEALASIAAGTPNATHWNAGQFREMLAQHPDSMPRRAVLLAENTTGCIAGFAVGSAMRAVFPVEADLESLVVASPMQGQGLGRRLLAAAMEWFAAQDAACVRLEVRAGNDRARRMYRHAGFVEAGRRPGYYSDPFEDALVMERILQP